LCKATSITLRAADHLLAARPGADHQRGVGLAGLALAELVLQVGQGAALLGDQQQPRRFAVQPMHQFEELRLRSGAAQLLDHAVAHPRAAMHRDTRRLVDHQQVLVLEADRELAGRRCRNRRLAQAQRRHAHVVSRLDTRIGAGPALVDAHLATADDPVDEGLGRTLEFAQQEVVEPLARTAFVHQQMPHLGGRGGRFPRIWSLARGGFRPGFSGPGVARLCPYNVLHHDCAVSV
jgi:hypothetical protein